MAFTKFILPVLAVAGTALAQCSGSTTITTSADAAALASCTTYKGDILISENASGQISIDGIQQITGNLICTNATQLTAITSDKLNSIGGVFGLNDLQILSTLQFSSLTTVAQIDWIALPALQGLNFDLGVSTANLVYISNTGLINLDGIDLTTTGQLNINNNDYLSTINLDSLTNVTTSLSISANDKSLAITLPSLLEAGNLTFIDISDVSLPALNIVTGSMGFYQDTMTSISAPNLTVTGGTLAFVDSPNLAKLSFPSIREIGGGFVIANNTDLTAITGFPKLSVIVGALNFAGTFGSLDLPALTNVRGGSNVQTSSTNDICTQLNNDHDDGVIRGVNTCITGKADPQANPSATGGGSTTTSTNGADSSAFDPTAPLTGLWALVAAILMI